MIKRCSGTTFYHHFSYLSTVIFCFCNISLYKYYITLSMWITKALGGLRHGNPPLRWSSVNVAASVMEAHSIGLVVGLLEFPADITRAVIAVDEPRNGPVNGLGTCLVVVSDPERVMRHNGEVAGWTVSHGHSPLWQT